MFLRTPVALAVLLSAHALATAQSSSSSSSSPDTGTDYVVTAARAAQALGTQVRPVQVITAENIRQSGAGSLTDLLRTLGGVEVTSNGGIGHSSSVFMRGANSDHTVVLLDGVRIGSVTLGSASLEAIPLALIERVEVLAGPSSSLYGADAIGGVIQIFTKGAKRSPGASVLVTAGNDGLRQLSGSYVARHGDTDISLGANVLSTDGFNVTTPANTFSYNPDRDGFLQRGANARVVQQLGGGHQVSAHWLRTSGKLHYDGSKTLDTYTNQQTQLAALQWQGPLLEGVNSEVRVGRTWDKGETVTATTGHIDSVQDQASWINRVNVGGGTLTAGAEWLRQSVDSDTAYDVTSRRVSSGLLGWRAVIGAVSVQADARHDRNSQFGNHTTAQLATAWQVDSTWRLRASAGTAFRAPSFNLLYYPGFGNPALQPERSTNFELGTDATVAGWQFGATLFDNRLRDLIDYAPPTYDPANVAKAGNRGLVFTAAGALGEHTRVKLNATVQNPENRDTGMQLRRRARDYAGVHVTHQIGAVGVGADWTLVGERFDSASESETSRMGGYGLLAVFANWRLTPEWQLEGRVANLANKSYTTAIGYASPGRASQISLRWTPAL